MDRDERNMYCRIPRENLRNNKQPMVAHFSSVGTSWERTESNMNDMGTVQRNLGNTYTNPTAANNMRFESMSNTWTP
jgi:hypothetical protein